VNEADVQINVMRLLAAYGRPDICFWHVPNGEHRSKRAGNKLKQMGVRRGVPDVHLMIDGLFHTVELKVATGRLKHDQIIFCEDIERAGGHFHVARGLNEAIGVLKGINAFRPEVDIQVSQVEPMRAAARSVRTQKRQGESKAWQSTSPT
jgi:hypothetical protein